MHRLLGDHFPFWGPEQAAVATLLAEPDAAADKARKGGFG
jgi:hypothetical protein